MGQEVSEIAAEILPWKDCYLTGQEGFGRYHYQENIQFCRISRGSLFEILDHLITSVDSGYITAEQFEHGRSRTLHAIKVLNGYLKMLQHAKMTSDPITPR